LVRSVVTLCGRAEQDGDLALAAVASIIWSAARLPCSTKSEPMKLT